MPVGAPVRVARRGPVGRPAWLSRVGITEARGAAPRLGWHKPASSVPRSRVISTRGQSSKPRAGPQAAHGLGWPTLVLREKR
jgi:hypothetical protein